MTTIILSSLAIFALLCLFGLSIGKRKKTSDIALALSALCLAVIEAADQYGAGGAYSEYKALGLVLAALLPSCLLWYGFTFARSEPVSLFSRRGGVLFSAAVLLPAAAMIVHLTGPFNHSGGAAFFPGPGGALYYLAGLVSFIIALMNLEATFVSAAAADRGKIRYEVIGAGGILTVLIFSFSQALLHPTMIVELKPIRSGLFIVASCLILYSKLVRGSGISVTVSRHMMYRSFTLLGAGVYFVGLGTIGEGINYFDVPFGRYLIIILSFAGGLALLISILSDTLRRSLMVFLSKHFFEPKHDYRHTWLDLSSRLASCMTVTDMEKAIPAAYREIFGLRSAYLYLFNRTCGRYLPAGQHQVPGPDSGFIPSKALQSYFCDRNRVWNPFDGEYEPDDEEISFISTSRARLVVPLVCNRNTEGVVVFGEPIGVEPFTYEDYDLMKIVARQAALLLNNLRLSEELIETRELAATARLSSFVVHDLKNLAYTLALMTHNAEEHIGNMQFQRDMIAAIRNALENMKQLTQKLKAVGQGEHRAWSGTTSVTCPPRSQER